MLGVEGLNRLAEQFLEGLGGTGSGDGDVLRLDGELIVLCCDQRITTIQAYEYSLPELVMHVVRENGVG